MAKKFTKEWWLELKPHEFGKEVERRVQAALVELNQSVEVAWHRLPDSHSAGRGIAAQPADFLVAISGTTFWLEVKGIKTGNRLPAKRLTQHAVLSKWGLAGVGSYVLTFHVADLKWRSAFIPGLEFGVPSWNLGETEAFDSPLEALLGFTTF